MELHITDLMKYGGYKITCAPIVGTGDSNLGGCKNNETYAPGLVAPGVVLMLSRGPVI